MIKTFPPAQKMERWRHYAIREPFSAAGSRFFMAVLSTRIMSEIPRSPFTHTVSFFVKFLQVAEGLCSLS